MNFLAFRGIKSTPKFNLGQTFVDKGYCSTAFDAQTASEFTTGGTGSGVENAGTIFRIKIPKGTKGLAFRGEEKEFLLGRNHEFKVVKISDKLSSKDLGIRGNDSFQVVDLEIIA